MRRRDFVNAIVGSAAGWPLLARAQQPTTQVSPALGQLPVDAFMAEELFGIAHPDQLLMFSVVLNPATQKVMKDGIEVPYQVDGSKIIVRAEGGIAANSSHIWVIASGSRSASPQVSIIDGGTYWQIDNTIIAVRVPKTIPITIPAQLMAEADPNQRQRINAPSQVLAPIQGVRHRDGTWTGTGPNYLYTGQTWNADWQDALHNFPALSASVAVLESGPLRAKVRMSYTAVRPAWGWPAATWEQMSYPSDTDGYFICTITLEAGQRSFLIEQETDGRPSWSVNLNTGVNADRARYRGHHSDSIAYGHNYDGSIYVSQHARADMDAEVNLADAGTRTNYGWYGSAPFDGVFYPRLYQWFTWDGNTGWFWHAYNSAGGANSNTFGVFQGRASTIFGGYDRIAFGLYGKPTAGVPTELGFYSYLTTAVGRNDDPSIPIAYLSPDNGNWGHTLIPRKASFSVFLGVKGTDVPEDFTEDFATTTMWYGQGCYATPSSINQDLNLHSGSAQFWKQLDQVVDFPDPVGGFAGMYLTRADTEALIIAIQNDTDGIYSRLYNQDSVYRDVWEAFHDATNAKAAALLQWTLNYITEAVEVYTNRGEIHALWWAYWSGATRFQAIAVRSQAMLSLNQIRPFLTSLQKQKIKAALSMCGHILWDNDFVPMDNWQSFTLGTANMPIQYGQARSQIACLLKDHSQFVARFATTLGAATASFESSVDAYGNAKDCPHYAGAAVIPVTDVFRQLQVAGYADVFAPESAIYDRLTGLAEWCMQVMTPKQVRFGNLRKMISYGDGASEGHDDFLSMIMGFEANDLTLSKRMAGAWADMGQPMSSFYASSALKIRPNFPAQDPNLGDADRPGYMTVMRSGWNTANESAVFLMHGDSLVDHGGVPQRGTPQIYLLGAPICICFGSMYSPKVSGPWVSCSTYIPVSEIGYGVIPPVTWDTATDLNLPCGVHSTLFQDSYTYNPTTSRVDLTCNFSVSDWVRRLTYYRDVLSQPVVRLRDSNTAGESVFTMHMMADGAVTKPDGSTVTPAALTGTPFNIVNGSCFKFTGQWGVSWDLYYFGPSAQAFIGMWSHSWAPGQEQVQYQQATGRSFEEKQYILRIKTSGPCDVVIVPYPTGQRPTGLNVVQVSGGLRVDPASRTLPN